MIEILFAGKPMKVQLTRAAETALRERTTPLVAELELYFSCMIRKRVRFYTEVAGEPVVMAGENLYVRFRPVMTELCGFDTAGDNGPSLTDFPIVNSAAYVPRWLRLDYHQGEWKGEFGYL